MPDPDRMRKRKDWPDGAERVCNGSVICFTHSSGNGTNFMVVYETPSEVHKLMKAEEPDAMLELHHYGDLAVTVYVRNEEIISIDARWDKVAN